MTSTKMNARLALAAATALTAFAAPAGAQQIDRIVAVGDSYADDGNAFELGYNNPVALAIYPTCGFRAGRIISIRWARR